MSKEKHTHLILVLKKSHAENINSIIYADSPSHFKTSIIFLSYLEPKY